MKIPAGTKERFSEVLASISENERFTIDRYTVKKGETFGRIAKKNGMPVPVILSLNAMEKIMPLKPGSVVYLPPKGFYSLDHGDQSLIRKATTYHQAHSHRPSARKASFKKAGAKKKVGKVSANKRLRAKSKKI